MVVTIHSYILERTDMGAFSARDAILGPTEFARRHGVAHKPRIDYACLDPRP